MAGPRKPSEMRRRIAAVLAVTVFAVLVGAGNFREASDRDADLSPDLLALAGCRRHRLTAVMSISAHLPIRQVAHDTDAEAIDAQVCRRIREQTQGRHDCSHSGNQHLRARSVASISRFDAAITVNRSIARRISFAPAGIDRRST